MKIEKLSDCSVKITLSRRDLSDYNISYNSWNSDITADFLLSVCDDIKAETGRDISCEKLYVEIFSRTNGCQIFVSYPPVSKSNKGQTSCIICNFSDYTSLKNFCIMIDKVYSKALKNSVLYYSTKILRLIISINTNYCDFIAEHSEYGIFSKCDEIAFAATEEYYNCVLKEDAVKQIISS